MQLTLREVIMVPGSCPGKHPVVAGPSCPAADHPSCLVAADRSSLAAAAAAAAAAGCNRSACSSSGHSCDSPDVRQRPMLHTLQLQTGNIFIF